MKFSFPSIKTLLNSSHLAQVSEQDWNSWHWQLRNALKNNVDFTTFFKLSESEERAFVAQELFNIRTTPYYALLAQQSESIKKILMPHAAELAQKPYQSLLDPLGERKNNPSPRIIHRYPDRALFLITDICSVYCRYCTRKHFTGSEQAFIKKNEFAQAIHYLKSHTGIREVILSGGDPLTVSDEQLERTLFALRNIEHIEIIRIGTRMPVVAPMRVTTELVKMIRQYKPVFLMTHFNHPKEITQESAAAVELFVDHGVPVMNQMVLLNGINNHAAIVQALSRRLLFLRAKPYYMFQCDPSEGTDHLRTSIENSLEIQKELWGNLSGLAMPTLSLDIPNGGGKTYYAPNFETTRSLQKRSYKGWDGVEAEYINPAQENILKPADTQDYLQEWQHLKEAKKEISSFEKEADLDF